MGISVSRVLNGWQVRFGKSLKDDYSSVYFSDSKYGGKLGALRMAKIRMNSLEKQYPEFGVRHYKKTMQRNNNSGKTGVSLYCLYDKRRRAHSYYWEALYHYRKGGAPVYRHKRYSVLKYGWDGAREKAFEFRDKWEEAVDQGYDAVNDFLSEYGLTCGD